MIGAALRFLAARLPARSRPALVRVHATAHHAARRLRAPLARRARVGRATLIERDVHVTGWGSVSIGAHCVIASGTVLNVNTPGDGVDRIRIGDWSFIGRRNFLSPGTLIEFGAYTMTGADCRLFGAEHAWADPFIPFIASGIRDRGTIRLGANVWLGAGVTVLGPVTIGHACVIGVGAFVTGDIPPFSIAVGTPARVVRRFDPLSRRWIAAADFTEAMAAALPDAAAYEATLRAARPTIAMPYAAAGHQRGDLA